MRPLYIMDKWTLGNGLLNISEIPVLLNTTPKDQQFLLKVWYAINRSGLVLLT